MGTFFCETRLCLYLNYVLLQQQPDEESVTQLQAQTKSKQVNTAILNKLHKEMFKLKAKQVSTSTHL
jgi:hypothetical protein